MGWILSFLMAFASASRSVAAEGPVGPPTPLGPHQRILLFKKNENPQNVMVIYTKTDERCHFALSDHKPVFDFYWLMDGVNYKPVHSLIKSGIRGRLQLDVAPGGDGSSSFFVNINDLSEVKNDLEHPRLLVHTLRKGARCDVEALVTMGPSDRRAVVRVDNLFADAELSLLPPFRKVVSVTLNGVNTETGQAFSRTFAKR